MFSIVKRFPKRSFLCLSFACATFTVCAFYTFYTETFPSLSEHFTGGNPFRIVDDTLQSESKLPNQHQSIIPPLVSYSSNISKTRSLNPSFTTTTKTLLKNTQVETKYVYLAESPSSSIKTTEPSIVLQTTSVPKNSDTCQMHTMKDSKVILAWTPFFEEWYYFVQKRMDDCQKCRNCLITTDRNKLEQSDAVIFHCRDMSLSDLPSIRYPHQRWIFYCLESPAYSDFPGIEHMVNMFNWTMTYRSDSSIVSPYGKFVRVRPSKKLDLQSLQWAFTNKTKSVVWMCSHCPTRGNRDDYVNDLRKYIDVDVFGSCGELVCPRNRTNDCLREFSSKYKFFLSFENSICKDYVTEKLFRTMKYDLIPVVFGGASYSKVAPPASFIDALSFKSPKHLAFFLAGIAKDFKMWSSYFRWRQDYKIDNREFNRECEVCSLLHKNDIKPSSYSNLKEWWVTDANCQAWEPNR